jgi:hypothetical protein
MTKVKSIKVEKDYKALYQNLSKRISRLHTYANNFNSGTTDMPSPEVIGRKLKDIAFGKK